jgi:hypothetical protein
VVFLLDVQRLLVFAIYSLSKRTLLEGKRGHVEFKRVVELCIQAFITPKKDAAQTLQARKVSRRAWTIFSLRGFAGPPATHD